MDYVVDMQGFLKQGGDLVLKELAIAPLQEDSEPLTFVFKEPFPWRRLTERYRAENEWLTRFYHGIPWDTDGRPYTEIGYILRLCLKDSKKVYVRGSLRKSWLERFKFNVIDLLEMGYSSSNPPKRVTICTNHNGAYKAACALHNVKQMKAFYNEHIHMECENI